MVVGFSEALVACMGKVQRATAEEAGRVRRASPGTPQSSAATVACNAPRGLMTRHERNTQCTRSHERGKLGFLKSLWKVCSLQLCMLYCTEPLENAEKGARDRHALEMSKGTLKASQKIQM